MTTRTLTRQPKGIPVGGQFATIQHGETTLTLDAPNAEPTEESVLAAAAEHQGPGAVPGIRRRLAEVTTDGGRQLFLQRCDALYSADSSYRVDRSIYGPSPEQCDALAALGYMSVNDVTPDKLKNFSGLDSLTEKGVGPDRLAVLQQLPTHEFQWSAWEKEAYLTADLDSLREALKVNHSGNRGQYLATISLLGQDKAEQAQQGFDLGLPDKGLVELEGHRLEVIAELRRALPDSKRGPWHIAQLADKAITARHLKRYGSTACEQYTAWELEAVPIPPKLLKSYLASGIHIRLQDVEMLQRAGFTSGADLKAASHAMGTSDPNLLSAARQHATGEQLADFEKGIPGKITVEDAKAIGGLARHGITEPAQLRPRLAEVYPAANQFCDRSKSILAIHARILDAGITAEHLGRMQRAGIPLDKAPDYRDSLDLWADGQKYRDVHAADRAEKLKNGWTHGAAPWAYTEQTYASGLTF